MKHPLCLLFFLMFLMSSCEENKFRESKVFVGNIVATAETLNLGRLTYVEYCVSCHGPKGDGNGIAAKGLIPPPRDFTKGMYKFGKVPAGDLLHDEDLKESIRKGLNGTAMLPWDISEKRLDAVVQYIKTFSPKVWEAKDKSLGNKVELITDPYSANTNFAIEKGKEVYHMVANCQSCHRAYVGREKLNQLSIKVNNQPMTDFDPTIYTLKLQESEYQASTIPPDFTWHEIRSAESINELAIRIAAGVGGTAMPSWKGVLTDEDIWAVSYYVKSLMDLKGHPKRGQILEEFK